MNDESQQPLFPLDTEQGDGPVSSPEPWPDAPEPIYQADMFGIPAPAQKIFPARVPSIGHALLFFVIALILLGIGQVLGVFLLQLTHIFPHRRFDSLFLMAANDARASIPIQALSYGLIALVSIPIFTVLWNEPFGEGVHWNSDRARRLFLRLALLGLIAGFSITLIGNYLPMPKDAPITEDMMKSATGAWLMLFFGLTAAPLLEELAFRGFLLPGLMNSFRWFSDRGKISEQTARRIGIPVSIIITSIGFAYLHSPQVSHAWGPLVLIGIVSIILCIVRLALNSVAAGVIVHSAYNFTLFAGVLYQTSGFRHLEKLTN